MLSLSYSGRLGLNALLKKVIEDLEDVTQSIKDFLESLRYRRQWFYFQFLNVLGWYNCYRVNRFCTCYTAQQLIKKIKVRLQEASVA